MDRVGGNKGGKNVDKGKTIGELIEEMRIKAGAQNYHGHDYSPLSS